MSVLTILGAGSVRCSPPVIASLSHFFGERPLEVRFYDADEERLDLFARLARVSFVANGAPHEVVEAPDLDESLLDADLVILQPGENCLRRFGRARGLDAAQGLKRMASAIPPGASSLSLLGGETLDLIAYDSLDWPRELTDDEMALAPHQVLRWIRGDEPVKELLSEYEKTPLREWLEGYVYNR